MVGAYGNKETPGEGVLARAGRSTMDFVKDMVRHTGREPL